MADRETLSKYLRKVTGELRSAQRRVLELEQHGSEPIAIVGMACRYPGGVSSVVQLWQLVAEGRDAISAFPEDRGWDLGRLYDPNPDIPGTSYTREGGFLDDAAGFDAGFFEIAPREALATDPQQRQLLEACWEGLEDAGLVPAYLRGSQTGVFAGVSSQDYQAGGEESEGYGVSGSSTSLVSGRIAYSLGLEGPAITVDTACSSSLVAMHLAAQALRSGECSLALAGGVTVVALPNSFIDFSRQRGLAPDGRCKAFAEAADGTSWSEGVGMLVLERLSEAERNGHRVLATIRGSAVNQDGASNGLTAPNGPSQERVIRQALANAGLSPQDVDAVEAHGTGTTLGDPIEAGALLATYGQDREVPLKLGSLKSNIGHAQAAAGVGGVIKTVMAMREGVLPKTLHVDAPSSKVDWEAGNIELLKESEPWQANGHPRRAGVSSFGISGTNAHLILEQAPSPQATDAEQGDPGACTQEPPLPGPVPLLLSAKSEPALREQASRLAAHLQANPELDPTDVAYSLATTRTAFEQRAVAVGASREELLEELAALGRDQEAPGIASARALTGAAPAFLFGGQGSQHAGMALGLLDSSPAFARHIAECEQALAPHVDWSLQEVLRDERGEWLDRLDVVQPALFAVMVSLARLWEDCGVRPAVVAGHSQGEIAAAHVAGGLSLDDAARVIARRAQAMRKLAGKGGMLSVALSPGQLAPRLDPFGERLSLAAINGPTSLVISGEPGALAEFEATCEVDGVRSKPVAVDYAAHSAQIEDLREELLEAFAPVSPRPAEIPFHSTVSGELLDTSALDAEYWYRNLRQSVLFEPVLRSMLEQGQRSFVEVSPHPVLAFGVQEAIDALPEAESAVVLGTLQREEGGPKRFALSLGQAHAAGIEVDWAAFFAGSGARAVALPTYPFQRKRYWLNAAAPAGDAGSIGQADPGHPLLGAVIADPRGEGLTLTGRLSLATHPWLADHALMGSALLPGTAFLELALRAGQEAACETVTELSLQAPLPLPEQGAVQVQVTVSAPDEQGDREVSIHSRSEAAGEEGAAQWACHAQGVLGPQAPPAPEPLDAWPPEGAEPLDIDFLYDRLAETGLDYGPAFQGLTAAWQDGEDLYAEVSLSSEQAQEAGRFGLHPALLDAALHAIALGGEAGGELRLPFAWSEVSLSAAGAAELRVKLSPAGEGRHSLLLADGEGRPVAQVGSLTTLPADPAQLGSAAKAPEGLLEIEWRKVSLKGDCQAAELRELDLDSSADLSAPTQAALELVQAWLAEQDPERRLAILTRGAIAATGEESPDPALGAAWGLLRSAQAEHPGRFLLIDSDGSEASEQALPGVLQSDEEPQIALREGVALVARAVAVKDRGNSLLPPPGPWRLGATRPGTLESLALLAAPDALEPLGPDQVRVAMRAAGLNFRDVLIALGLYPGEATIGSEGAGTVVEVGAGVSDLAPGDPVMGMVSGAFAPLAIAERRLLAPAPQGWSFGQAAAVPSAFATAYHGLVDLAGLRAGEKVLIHAGAGGVGMAAIQIAQHLGAEVFATASPAKWDVLGEAEIDHDHIASSRDLSFKEKFLQVTEGEGVDVVLNSLAGEFVDASLGLLVRGGHLIEMGKTDIRDGELLAKEHPGVSYRAFDLTQAGPDRLREILAETLALFERGELHHCPLTSWDLRRAPEAFRHLREGKNVGKVVLEIPRPLDPERTALITGGLGGLGALSARHLAEAHGARHLLLVSRSGAKAPGAKELKEELTDLGAKVKIAACDVSDRDQVEALIASIPKKHPLGAVIHAAGALEDATIEALGPEQIDNVFAPKATAAQHLHELTSGLDLSAFVLFSSAAGALGAPGQGNYAAANAYLDALAQKRRGEGLPATSIAWGLWQRESAMTAHLGEADLARMARSGMQPLSDQRGLALLDLALGCDRAGVLALALDRAGLRAQAAPGSLSPILSGLVGTPARRRPSASSLAGLLASTVEEKREAVVLDLVRAEVASVLGHGSFEAIEPARAFKQIGFDSLAAVELRNRLQAATGLRLAATAVFDYPSPAALAGFMAEQATAAGAVKAVAARRQATDEPIAIVGMACRYPGANGPEALWQLVAEGRDGIGDFPGDRGWDLARLYHPDPDHRGTSYVREGGFLADPARFDCEFFDIAPREALAMDPQQRLLLETSWEALEDAGIDPASLRGGAAGVFAGISSQDYATGSSSVSESEGYIATGASTSVASGRIAYSLGLEGPAITVDTACSSSLVAMHLAAQALRAGECSLALAGGATVLATPATFTEISRQRGLAPDGRCKAFAEAADGTGFSEGAGLLVLERLSEAERNGHPVLATIRGSAVNQDGASNGLTAPNGPSQERVIRQALANAGLEPKDVDAVEAHGTGTTLGDPIEAQALLATYGQDRETPLKLGSLKSNIGHAQAAAGVGGVIKTVMAMREGVLPKTLHVDSPSSKVDWEAGRIELLSEAEPWEANGHPRRAGVSSFGISGTNAHLILEEAAASKAADVEQDEGEADPTQEAPLPGPIPLLLSAKSQPALREQAARLAAHLRRNPDLDLADVAHSLATTRAAFEHRAVAVGASREQLLEQLAALGRDREAPGIVSGRALSGGAPVFLFPGQGSQWLGMGAELLSASPAFARHIDDCEQALSPHLEWSVRDLLAGIEGTPSIERIEVVQPALFAVMVSLAKLWEDCGVRPAAVVGHSQGEIAAAHVAGALSLEDAAMLAAVRSRIIAKLAGKGAMVLVALAASELGPRIEHWGDQIELAAENGPSSTILSVSGEALAELLRQCEEEGLRAREVAATVASHSARVEPLRGELLEAIAGISPRAGEIPFYSTVTGAVLDGEELGAGYWYRNLRQPVRFEQVLRELLGEGERLFVEVSPHPVFALAVRETIEHALDDPAQAAVLETLRRDEGGPQRFALSLAALHAAGGAVDWRAILSGAGKRRVSLPTYPFQGKRYWQSPLTAGAGDVSAAGQTAAEHPLLGAMVDDPRSGGFALTGRLSLATHPWLADHAVAGTVLLPGAAFVELALQAGERAGTPALEELTLAAPLVLPAQGAVQLQVSVDEADGQGRRAISIHSRVQAGEEEGDEWTQNASGALAAAVETRLEEPGAWPPAAAQLIELEDAYDRLAIAGLEYGPAFQGLTAAWQDGERLYAEVSLPEEQASQAQSFGLHPALLDAALHALALEQSGEGELQLPFTWGDVSLFSAGAGVLRATLVRSERQVSLLLADAEGRPVARVGSLAVRPVDTAQLAGASKAADGLLEIKWREFSPLAGAEPAELRELGSGSPTDSTAPTRAALELAQEWLSADRDTERRLAIVTRGAVASNDQESPDPALAAAWGLLRSAQSEHPGRFVLIDTDGSDASAEAIEALLDGAAEPQIALREGVALAPSATPLETAAVLEIPRPLDPERTALITGGLGGLGALSARHLAEAHGARHLLLVSRSGAKAPGAKELKEELTDLGAKVKIAACDVSDRDQVEALIASIPKKHPLGAVIHAAGALEDATIEALGPEQIDNVFAPKATAAQHLHELTSGLDLSAFVLFSSAAGALGAPGQGNYAAANAYLDALAQKRRGEGLPATSIAWGLWQRESAMTAHLGEADLARMARSGMQPLSDQRGLALLDLALGCDRPGALALNLNLSTLRSRAQAGALPAILGGLVRSTSRRRPAAGSSFAARLASLAAAERENAAGDLVRSEAAAVLGHDSAAAIEPTRAFKELGFDSLAAVELRNRLQAATGLRLAATAVFDYPSPVALARHIVAAVSGEAAGGRVAVRAGATDEPIAIISMACRFPGGAQSPDQLWQLIAAGDDAISSFPEDRGWDLARLYHPDPDHRGTSYTRHGGFLDSAAEFDADFFGIGPREAQATDPQQRLLLEVAWEALERAGIDPASLFGTGAGVFAGVASLGYGIDGAAEEMEGYLISGTTSSVASGRIAYSLGLEGPAITVDTACSSSLVAMHLAAQALRAGECSLALAGGATVLANPSLFKEFSRQRGLAPDGRCKAFAEAADGTGFSEGAGLLVLERLSEAERNGHPVLATIRGSAVNQDGASNGLTAPNGPSQERVIRQALANAGLEPKDVDAVEAHGTGTTLGDPIEAQALLATYGQDRETPLKLGSVKSNIGHTQAAAGVAGVIKTVMAIREGVLPKTLHVDAPSSKVDWEAGRIELLSEAEPWEANGHPRRAGVSSFGISGTNAHLILEGVHALGTAEVEKKVEDPDASPQEAPPPGPVPLVLSAKSQPALREQASRLAAHLRQSPDLELADVAHSLATTRTAFEHRAVAVAATREELLGELAALAEGSASPATVLGSAQPATTLAYLFSGQGSQRVGMGRELYETYPAFATAFDAAAELFDGELGAPLGEVVFGAHPEAGQLLASTAFAQPALFAVEVALYRLLESRGLVPQLLCGHSVGELAAAHVAGVFSLPEATRLVAARGRLMAQLPAGGAMIAIEAAEQEVAEAIAGREAEVAIAAVNGPGSTVLSGEERAVEELAAAFAAQGRKTKRLDVSHAFHSPLIEPMIADFAAVAESIAYAEPAIPLVSNLSGELLSAGQAVDPAYWVAHVREPVRFMDGVRSLAANGASAYLELGPDPVLIAMAQQCLPAEPAGAAVLAPSLRQGRPEAETLALALASAHVAGAKIEWRALFEGSGAKRVSLPTYPFRRKHYWLAPNSGSGSLDAAGLGDAGHPLLAAVVEDPTGEGLTLTGRISLATHPWLADHAVAGTVLLPGTACLELALRAGEAAGAPGVEELTLQTPLVVPPDATVQLQVSVGDPDQRGRRQLSIHSRPQGAAEQIGAQVEWAENAAGWLSDEGAGRPEPEGAWPPAGAEALPIEDLYRRLAGLGIEYGPSFQGLTAAWVRGEEIYAEVSLPAEHCAEAGRFAMHPALFDAAHHAIALTAIGSEGEALPLPFAWRDVSLFVSGASELRVALSAGEGGISLRIADRQGLPVATVGSLAVREVDRAQIEARGRDQGLLAIEWQAVSPSSGGEGAELHELESDLSLSETGQAQAALRVIQQWLAEGKRGRLAILTSGAVAAGAGELPDPAAAAAWGLVRSAQAEHPGRFALIDSDGSDASAEAIEALLSCEPEPELALREGRVLAPRIASPVPGTETRAAFDPGRTVLVTGATGGLGALVSRHLVEAHGVRHLLLASRRGTTAKGAGPLRAALEELGVEARIVACDVSDRNQLRELLGSIPDDRPLGAVIHTAAALDDATIERLEPAQLERGFAAKAHGARHLHELTAELDLSAFVLFSSAAGSLATPGQGGYAAANAYLDALAQRRRAEPLPAISIAWGMWERESAMTAQMGATDLARLHRAGIAALTDERGLALFDQALGSQRATALALALDSVALRAQAQAGELPPVFSGLVRSPRRRTEDVGPSLAGRLAAAAEAEHESLVLDLVKDEVATVLGHRGAAAIEPDRAFKEIGFDSLAAVELRNRLNASTGLQLEPTMVFDFPTPAALAGHLLELVAGNEGSGGFGIEELTQALTAMPPADPGRPKIAAQLRALAADLEGADEVDSAGLDPERLRTASDEELLDFIDAQVDANGSPGEPAVGPGGERNGR